MNTRFAIFDALRPSRARRQWRAVMVCAMIACGPVSQTALADEYKFGINAEVSYKESEAEVRHRYAPFLQELGKLTGHQFVFYPVYSDRVAQATAARQYDFMLIHTHAALEAEKQHQFQMVGFTDDRKNNQVYFFVKPASAITSLAQSAAAKIGVPGMQSWATATARAALKEVAPGQSPTFVATRYQDAVPLMVELNAATVGITRSQKLVDEHVAKKGIRVIHTTPAMPLNALVAAPTVPVALVNDVREVLGDMTKSKVFDAVAFKGLHFSTEENQRLHAFYQ